MTLELLFAERNHVCSSCVANGHCELQTLGYSLGMDHVRYDYLFPKWGVDTTHRLFGMDHNRCILCTRCVRVCWHIEGAGTKNVPVAALASRPTEPWGEADSCTACGKCVGLPHGRLYKGSLSEMDRPREIRIYRHCRKNNGSFQIATVWFGSCSSCHMSFLDLDEFLIELTKVDIVSARWSI
jgi:bidirectional [NiFe] hydrogenase diaphorase subunit